MLTIIREKGGLMVSAQAYSLTFANDRPFVYLADARGSRLADLFIFSAVHPLHGRDDVTGICPPESGTQMVSTVELPAAAIPAASVPGLNGSAHFDPWEVSERPGEILLSCFVESSVWRRKIYRFICRPHCFMYEIEIEGQGHLCEVDYFGGYSSSLVRWGSGYFWSGQKFQRGFTPEPNKPEINYFAPGESAFIDLIGVPLPGRDNWFFTPPPFCFAFEGPESWIGVGVEAPSGGYRFNEYGYHGRHGGFHLSLSYEGHTAVRGVFRLPAIGFHFGADEFAVLAAHVQALQETGASRPSSIVYRPSSVVRRPSPAAPSKPAWWYEPIFCGWGAQSYLAELDGGWTPDYSRQSNYESFLETLDAQQVDPGIVVLDDKWQTSYGDNHVDEGKWPDLPGFISRQHARGRKVLLWLKAWDPQGLPPEDCITNARGLPLAVDPTNPAYERRLRESVRRMLAPDGYGADGFKVDFTARIPSGPGICLYGDLWGLELMKQYLWILYQEAKRCRPDALVMTHTPHPYLADVLDMVRLNDINPDKDVCPAMALRARVASIACPGAVIDTDNWPMADRRSWRDYLRLQPELGVPSLYYVSHIDKTREPLEPEDYQLIREVWARHRANMAKQLTTDFRSLKRQPDFGSLDPAKN